MNWEIYLARLLITGGSGDLGRPLCKLAIAAGHEVWATYVNHPERIKAGQPTRVDLTDKEAIDALVRTVAPDIIIHTAVDQSSPEMIVNSAMYLRDVARASIRFINLSSDLVFDGTKPPYREDSPYCPLSDYGRAKAKAESFGDCVVRTSLIYDFERGNKQIDWLLNTIENGGTYPLFYDEYRNPIWSWNLAEAVLELAQSNLTGVINVAGPSAISRLELGLWLLICPGYIDSYDHIQPTSQAGMGRPANLRLELSRAQTLLSTRLLTVAEACMRWSVEHSGRNHL